MVCGPNPKDDPEASGLVGTIAPAQLSFAVGAVHVTMALQVSASADTEKSVGQPANTGGVLSVTVTTKEQVL